jgi:hypothetical protein
MDRGYSIGSHQSAMIPEKWMTRGGDDPAIMLVAETAGASVIDVQGSCSRRKVVRKPMAMRPLIEAAYPLPRAALAWVLGLPTRKYLRINLPSRPWSGPPHRRHTISLASHTHPFYLREGKMRRQQFACTILIELGSAALPRC